ncbi:MAG: AAA family ATPase, partial [Planctomycetota bacterium]
QVSVGGNRMPLPDPFFVLATQNPIEQEGTYPLPEAQQDRFMFKIFVDYPRWEEEQDIIRLTTAENDVRLSPVLSGEEVLQLQHTIRRVPVADHVVQYAMRLVRVTRVHTGEVPDVVREYVSWGAGPRACQFLILAGKVRAVLHGRVHVATEDIRALAGPVLRHRVVTNFNADAEGLTSDDVIDRLLAEIPAHESAIEANPRSAGAVEGSE